MDYPTLLSVSENDKFNGISVQDPERLAGWLEFGEIISERDEGDIINAYVYKNHDRNQRENIILKSHRNPECLRYEYLVGLEVNKLRFYVDNFVMTYGLFLLENRAGYAPHKNPVIAAEEEFPTRRKYTPYLMIEKVYGNPLSKIIENLSNHDIHSILLQLFNALQIAQDQIQFTHYDLHLDNVIITELVKPQQIKYSNLVLETNYQIKIIDYGSSHASIIPISDLYACLAADANIEYGNIPSIFDPLVDAVRFTRLIILSQQNNVESNANQTTRSWMTFIGKLDQFIIQFAKNNLLTADGAEDESVWTPYVPVLIHPELMPKDLPPDLFKFEGKFNYNRFYIPLTITPLTRTEYLQRYIHIIRQSKNLGPIINTKLFDEIVSGYKLYIVQQRPNQTIIPIINFLTQYDH